MVRQYGIDRLRATTIVMTSFFCMNRSVSTGTSTWASRRGIAETRSSYIRSTRATDPLVKKMVQSLLRRFPNLMNVLIFGQDAWDACQGWLPGALASLIIQTGPLPHPTLLVMGWLTRPLRRALLDNCCIIVGRLVERLPILIQEDDMDSWYRRRPPLLARRGQMVEDANGRPCILQADVIDILRECFGLPISTAAANPIISLLATRSILNHFPK